MNDRAVSLFERYELEIIKTRKGRGAIIAETNLGLKSLTLYQGYKEKADLQELLMEDIKKKGFLNIDCFMRNKDEELITLDYEGKKYVVKDYLQGKECNVLDIEECKKVVKALAMLHTCMRGLILEYPNPFTKESIIHEFEKRTIELKRVRSFIRKNTKKTDFEMLFLKVFDRFMEQAMSATNYLSDEVCQALCDQVLEQATYIHGDCSHHNFLFDEKSLDKNNNNYDNKEDGKDCKNNMNNHINCINIINFEKYKIDVQARDLTLFLRKALEKNSWSVEYGTKIINAYIELNPLSREEKIYMYTRLAYPEKFWKIANSYLNQRKSLPAKRQYDKLITLLYSEEKRMEFLQNYRKKYL